MMSIEAYNSLFPAVFSGDREESSSSIGEDSGEDSGGESGDGYGEVQSVYKGSLDCFDALEQVLPIKKGMSKFYNGKSKSFTSLAEISCSSIKEIVKPENALSRKRKNLIAHATFWDKNRDFPPGNFNGSISKKPTNSNRSTSSTISSNESNNSDSCNSNASSPIFSRPPLHPQSKKILNKESPSSPIRRNFSPWRSFSLSDLHDAAVTTPTTSMVTNKEEVEKPH